MEGRRQEGHSEPRAAAQAIAPVIAKLEAIAAQLDEDDGVRRFNELFLAVTREVAGRTAADTFEDARFISRLDVVFAVYFAAVADDAAGREPSKAWAPLFAERHKHGVAPLQFAIAGMNAHINHDLALALVATCRQLAIGLATDSPQHRDYIVVNGILEKVQDAIKERFTTGVIATVDEAFGTADDLLASWSVARARRGLDRRPAARRDRRRLPAHGIARRPRPADRLRDPAAACPLLVAKLAPARPEGLFEAILPLIRSAA